MFLIFFDFLYDLLDIFLDICTANKLRYNKSKII